MRNSRELQNVYTWIFSPCRQTNPHVSSRIQTWWTTAQLTSSATQFTRVFYTVEVKVKVKQSIYRPGQGLKVLRGRGSQISWQSTLEGGKFISPTHRPSLLQEIFQVLISVTGWVDPRTTTRPEGLCQWKIPNGTIGNRTRNLPACSAVPQPTAPPRDTLRMKQFLLQNTQTTQILTFLLTLSTRTHIFYTTFWTRKHRAQYIGWFYYKNISRITVLWMSNYWNNISQMHFISIDSLCNDALSVNTLK